MGTVREELHKLFSEPELVGVPLLVLANKNDLPKSAPAEEIAEELGYDHL
jgi:ADP-ribosylation factor-like protein 8